MDAHLVAILSTIALTLLALAGALVAHQRGRGPRAVMTGIGLALIPVGLWITGVMDLVVNGITSIIRWLNRTPMDVQRWIGIAVVGLGVLLVIAALAVRPRTKDEARAVREARRQPAVGAGRSRDVSPTTGRPGEAASAGTRTTTTGTGSTAPATRTQPKAAAVSDEDAEIEAILKKRGIT